MEKFNERIVEHSNKIAIGFLILAIVMNYFIQDYMFFQTGYSISFLEISEQYTGLIVLLVILIIGPILLRKVNVKFKDVLFVLFSAITLLTFLLGLLFDINYIFNMSTMLHLDKMVICIYMIFVAFVIYLLSYFIVVMSVELFNKRDFIIIESMGLVFLYYLGMNIIHLINSSNLIMTLIYFVVHALISGLLFFSKEYQKVYKLIIGFLIINQLVYFVRLIIDVETKDSMGIWVLYIFNIEYIFLILVLLLMIKKKEKIGL